MPGTRFRSVVGATTVILSPLIGCGVDRAPVADQTSKGGAVDGPVMRYPQPAPDDVSMEAEVSGVLELEGDCLYVALDEIGERFPVLWPFGTRWDAENRAVVPPTGAPMPIGGSVVGAGGYLGVSDVERVAGADAASAAERCVDNTWGEIAVVNNQDTAIGLAAD